MSAYYDVYVSFVLRADIDGRTLAAISSMVDLDADEPDALPEHELFTRSDWRRALLGPGTDDPTSGQRICFFTKNSLAPPTYTLQIRCLWHDDEFHQALWELFDWFASVSSTVGFVGFFREVYAANPTLIYFIDQQVYLNDCSGPPHPICNEG